MSMELTNTVCNIIFMSGLLIILGLKVYKENNKIHNIIVYYLALFPPYDNYIPTGVARLR